MLNMVISSVERFVWVLVCFGFFVWCWFGLFFYKIDVCLKELDLTNPKTFRNLAKPMGAQTEDRLAQYKKRYKDWEDPNGKYDASCKKSRGTCACHMMGRSHGFLYYGSRVLDADMQNSPMFFSDSPTNTKL